MLSSLLFFGSCTDEDIALLCQFEVSIPGSELTFEECTALLSKDIDEVFLTAGNPNSTSLNIGGWKNQLGSQSVTFSSTASFTDESGTFYTATSGTFEFTKIDSDKMLLEGNYNFEMENSAGEMMPLEGTFENMSYVED